MYVGNEPASPISVPTRVQDAEPITSPPYPSGAQWYESDTAGFYLRYRNPDGTFTWVALAGAGGDFLPLAMRGVANGVASLDAAAQVPAAQGGVPTGTILDYAGAAAPTGYLLCDGASYTTASQPALFAAIGYVYGGAGANFNVPDMRGRSASGKDNMGGTAASRITTQAGLVGTTLGSGGGLAFHGLTVAEMPAHGHSLSVFVTASSVNTGSAYLEAVGRNDTTNAGVAGTAANGGSAAHNNMQPTLILNKIIKT